MLYVHKINSTEVRSFKGLLTSKLFDTGLENQYVSKS